MSVVTRVDVRNDAICKTKVLTVVVRGMHVVRFNGALTQIAKLLFGETGRT